MRADVSDFLAPWAEGAVLPPDDADLFDVLGIDGDDAFEFIDAFAGRFSIDVSSYRWYFHHGEEGFGPGGLLFRSPDRRVKRIPISVEVLSEAVRTGRWPIDYPPHSLPKVRWDIRLNQAFGLLILASVVLWAWYGLVARG
ncbi:DUF1493 family protein [Phenylobacterium sp.]|uniref:DUF1493 family protein n=1 Tax=Phenylobacterium sp. TaxID=1871053 RepID=UPI0025D03DB5|nr:DUF1493 family protein [Phenylobacterium sp.]